MLYIEIEIDSAVEHFLVKYSSFNDSVALISKGGHTSVVQSLSTKFIKNSQQNLPGKPIFRDKA